MFDWVLNTLLVTMVFFLFIATVGNVTENGFFHGLSQPAFICSKSTMETAQQYLKSVQN